MNEQEQEKPIGPYCLSPWANELGISFFFYSFFQEGKGDN